MDRALRPSVAAADIMVSTVRRGDVANTINAAGVVISVHEEVVASPVVSRIAKVHAKPGQQVQAGELLLELDDREIRLALDALRKQLAQQENRVASLNLELVQKHKQLLSGIELLELDLLSSRALNERNQKLRQNGLVSGENLLAGELAVKRAEIQLRQQRQLFTPFFSTKQGSQGIGLMFVREVLMRHGLPSSLASTGAGETRFEMRFPHAQ